VVEDFSAFVPFSRGRRALSRQSADAPAEINSTRHFFFAEIIPNRNQNQNLNKPADSAGLKCTAAPKLFGRGSRNENQIKRENDKKNERNFEN
jgi:hypothetical protein